jgi:hypothetical protein
LVAKAIRPGHHCSGAVDGYKDPVARYRVLYAERLAVAAIAKAQAQRLTVEIYALRAMVGMGEQGAPR